MTVGPEAEGRVRIRKRTDSRVQGRKSVDARLRGERDFRSGAASLARS